MVRARLPATAPLRVGDGDGPHGVRAPGWVIFSGCTGVGTNVGAVTRTFRPDALTAQTAPARDTVLGGDWPAGRSCPARQLWPQTHSHRGDRVPARHDYPANDANTIPPPKASRRSSLARLTILFRPPFRAADDIVPHPLCIETSHPSRPPPNSVRHRGTRGGGRHCRVRRHAAGHRPPQQTEPTAGLPANQAINDHPWTSAEHAGSLPTGT